MSLDGISIFVRAAGFAGLTQLWREAAKVFWGPDALSGNAAVLGAAIVLGIAPLFVRRETNAATHLWKRHGLSILAAFAVLVYVATLALPKAHWPLSSFPQSFAWLVGAHAIGFAMFGLFARGFLEDCTAQMPVAILGFAAGIFLQEFALLPWVGWLWSSLLWSGIFFFLKTPAHRSAPPAENTSQKTNGVIALAIGFAIGSIFATSKVFLCAHLSSTRFSSSAILGVFLLGLGLGASTANAFAAQTRGGFARPLSAAIGCLLAASATFWILAQLACAPYFPVLEKLFIAHPGWAEVFLAVQALGLGSVALGAALALATPMRTSLSLAFLGMAIGIVLGAQLLPVSLSDRFVPRRPGEQVFESKVTEGGILRRVRAPKEGPAAAVRWNRDPLSRQSDWLRLEQEEIFFPARLHPQAVRALVVGTPFVSHRTAITIAAPPKLDLADPIPPFLDDRAQGRSLEPRLGVQNYDWIALLSSPTLTEGKGRLLTQNFFHAAKESLQSGGSLFVWVELRSIAPEEIPTLLRSFCAVFPMARLWMGQDLYAGPLLCLDSGAAPASTAAAQGMFSLLAEGKELEEIAGQGARSNLLHPRLELFAPLRTNPLGIPDPATLRQFAAPFTDGSQSRPGIYYLLDSLALHSEAQNLGNLFSSRTERIEVTQDEIEQASIGLELHPENALLRSHLQLLGQLILEKRDYAKALLFFPRWVEASPTSKEFLTLLARAHYELLDDELALPLAEKAAALDAENMQAHELLGDVHARLKQWPQAIQAYASALSLVPQSAQLAKKLGLAHFQAGEQSQAGDWLLRASAGLPGDREILEALEKLGRR